MNLLKLNVKDQGLIYVSLDWVAGFYPSKGGTTIVLAHRQPLEVMETVEVVLEKTQSCEKVA